MKKLLSWIALSAASAFMALLTLGLGCAVVEWVTGNKELLFEVLFLTLLALAVSGVVFTIGAKCIARRYYKPPKH